MNIDLGNDKKNVLYTFQTRKKNNRYIFISDRMGKREQYNTNKIISLPVT
jgi:hypothetical protein